MTVFEQAAEAIKSADHLLITAGAGMGVDSGLPDFRGNKGFWNAYPAFKNEFDFIQMANPKWFYNDPKMAWGFYGHRIMLYRNTEPHQGFQILREFAAQKESHFIFTSNVDGHFQRAGFDPDKVVECHGTGLFLQCTLPCCSELYSSDDLDLEIDHEKCLATSELPRCDCGAVMRPNILMFGDHFWLSHRTDEQQWRYTKWKESIDLNKLVTIEMGAGTAVPTVRFFSERHKRGSIIRINPREPQGPEKVISIATGALEALSKIKELL